MGFREACFLNFGIFGAALLLSVMSSYYIKVFTQKYKLPISYLNIVQWLFLLWNAINDPLMGYMQDIGFCGMKWIMNRRKVVLYAGPVFSLTYMLFWIPWDINSHLATCLQLLVSLFIFDTLLTLVLSAYCGMVVEQSAKHSDRVRNIVLGEIFGLAAGCFIFPVESLSHSLEDFRMFQYVTVVIVIVSAASFILTGCLLTDDDVKPDIQLEEEKLKEGKESEPTTADWRAALQMSLQVIKQFRFLCLVGGQFFRILRFFSNELFLIITVENLLIATGYWKQADGRLGLYYVLVRSVASILFLASWTPTNKLGAQTVIQIMNSVALVNCFLMLYVGRDNYLWIVVFIVIENAIARCGWHGYYMIIGGEVIDTDAKIHNRKTPISTVIFTLKAFLTKPADQLGPIIITTIYDKSGFIYSEQCVSSGGVFGSVAQNSTTDYISSTVANQVTFEECDTLQRSIFLVLVVTPIICSLGEMFFIGADQLYRRNLKRQLVESDDTKKTSEVEDVEKKSLMEEKCSE